MSKNTEEKKISGVNIIGQQAKEADKGLKKIIALWKTGLKDKDPRIRFLTVIASLIGFILLFMIVVMCIHPIVYFIGTQLGATFSAPPIDKYVYVSMASAVLLALVGIWGALRISDRAPANMLAAGMENIYEQKYGAKEY